MKKMFKIFTSLLLALALLLTPCFSTTIFAAEKGDGEESFSKKSDDTRQVEDVLGSLSFDDESTTTSPRATPSTFSRAVFPDGIYYIKNLKTNQYIDIHGPYTDMIHQWTYHTDPQEIWEISHRSNGFYTIKSLFSGKYLGISSTDIGTDNITQYTAINNNTLWYIEQNKSKQTLIMPKNNTNLFLCAPNDGIGSELQLKSNYDMFSRWKLIELIEPEHKFFDYNYTSDHTVNSNLFFLLQNSETTRFACPYGPYLDEGTTIHQWDYINTIAMQWEIKKDSSNTFYKIRNVYTGKYLGYTPDENGDIFISQYSSNSLNCVKWNFYLSSTDSIVLTPKEYEPFSYSLSVDPEYNDYGSYLKLVEYTPDDNFKDEWNLFSWKGSYLGEVDNNVWHSDGLEVAYWDATRIPRSVNHLDTDDDTYWNDAVEVAENQWYGVTYIPFSSPIFSTSITVYGGLKSQIREHFSDTYGLEYKDEYLGITAYNTSFEGIIRMGNTNTLRYLCKMDNAVVYSETGNDDGYYTRNKVYRILSHEMGHAIGYVGHAPFPTDVMHAYENYDTYLLQPEEFSFIYKVYKKFTR